MSQESPRSLDEIMSREPAAASDQTSTETASTETEGQTQPRDEHGKFATTQQPAAEATVDTDEEAQGADVAGDNGSGKVPVQAAQAAREKARQERERADRLEREVAELRGQVSVLTRPQPQQQPQQEKPKPVDFWENPEAFIAEHLTPLQQSQQQQRIDVSEMLAVEKHGAEAVSAAKAALTAAIQANPNDPDLIALDQRSRQSIHPMNDVVNWHNRRKAMADIGDDPTTYRERVRQEVMAELAAANPAPAQQQQPAAARTPMPGNFAGARSEGPRSGVTYSGPRPLSEIAKGSAQ